MHGFRRNAQGHACLGETPLFELLAASGLETPVYFYDLDAIAHEGRELSAGYGSAPHIVAYAVKANSAGSVIRALAAEGTGADVVSGAELEVALGCGIPAHKIVMSGVAKKDGELDFAIASGIFTIQAESVEELSRIAARARALGRQARIGFRLNPGVEIDSHAHISTGHDRAKFGIARADVARAFEVVDSSNEALVAVGLSAHIGSMLSEVAPYLKSAERVCEVARARRAKKPGLEYVSFGGGFGIDYGTGQAAKPADFARQAIALRDREGLSDLLLVAEPGRALVGAHGVLIASVVQTKVSGENQWLMIDAGMNDLIRPALYGAKHRIEPIEREPSLPEWRVVGPVCESSDDFGAHPIGPNAPTLVVVRDVGAYGFTMASEYNGRALASEVFVKGGNIVSRSASPGVAAWVKRRLSA
ncbi:MAG TPA: diaminopimelate decarboxylase [Polyangiaceae bacterium]|jgi:diaminopimelate decarboxylase|nr:diaminopimelate decarboxylase [Polyangiaceae bacterium]